ncbi:hypothetical protein [Roseimarinus sediminis]|uniref:hypothetical protein n=1 Tax=Roseimarinus sediminis TaxID=1610899 RepID=UPI003D1C5DF0
MGKLILPTVVIMEYKSEKLTLRLPEFMSRSYFDNSQCYLHFNFARSTVFVDYYCEDDFYLSDKLDLDDFAKGDLEKESFEAIQERALKLLCQYIDDDQQEMLEHFDHL